MPAMLTRRGGTEHAPPRNDAYVVLLIISLVAMILGCALLWMDYGSYPDGKAPTVAAPQRPQAGGAPGGAGGGFQDVEGGKQPNPPVPPANGGLQKK